MRDPGGPKEEDASEDGDEVELTSSGEVVLTPSNIPPKGEPGKRIHPRRPLPPVPEAKPDEPDLSQPEELEPEEP